MIIIPEKKKIKTEFIEKHFDHGTLRFKDLSKTRASKRRSGGYSYQWEGKAYYVKTGKLFGTFSRTTGSSIKDLRSDIRAGLVYIKQTK